MRSLAGLVAVRSGPVAAVRPPPTRLTRWRSRTGAGRPPPSSRPERPALTAPPLTPAVRAGVHVHQRPMLAATHAAELLFAGPPGSIRTTRRFLSGLLKGYAP